ncbi:MAG: SIMPL domain-containing protein, partial [Actinomycetota bacterium]
LGVQTQADTAQAALAQNADKMNAVIAAVIAQGITKDDLATEGVSLYPTYGQNGQNVTGYQASNVVDVTVRQMNKVGVIIDTAVGAGANLANGITFQLSDQNQGMDTALAAAVADAKSKAEALASAGDAQLGQVVSIDETTGSSTPPVFYDRATSAGASAPTPVQPPTLETQVSVTVVWQLT